MRTGKSTFDFGTVDVISYSDRNGSKSQIWRRFKRVREEGFETASIIYSCSSNFATKCSRKMGQ